MSTKIVLAVAAIALGMAAHPARAEGEGNGDPFPVAKTGVQSDGWAFVRDTAQSPYPELTGRPWQDSTVAQLEPAFGHEAPIQTAASLPRGFTSGTVAYAQAQSLNAYAAAQMNNRRLLEAGIPRPQG